MKQNKPHKTKPRQKTQRTKEQGHKQRAATRSENRSPERINRYLAHCGLCSRREADRWILAGRVSVNGEVVNQPGITIQPTDRVCVDGKAVNPQTTFTYILYNKPTGQLCSRKDDKGRPLIYEHLDVAPNVQSVGRLDMDTEGLLLLTDDGELTRKLTHPGTGLPRQYRARVAGRLSLETLKILRDGGLDIGKGDLSEAWEITVDSETRGHSWLTITINRGRWREVRRTLEVVEHSVRRLMRIKFGPIRLEEGMPRGSWRKLNRNEIRRLRELGEK